MNRSALKTYAPKARLDFIRAVTDRAAFYGVFPDRINPITESGDVVLISGRAFPRTVSIQRRSLEARIQRQGFVQVMEAMAYTWFNRFVALRYMELHGYLDHGYRVLSPSPDLTSENAKNAENSASSSAISVVQSPEILDHAEHVTLPGLDAQQVINLKLDGTKEAELYRLLLVAQCNALNEAMPFLFEKIADETELLLPDNLLHSDSVIRKLVNEIEEADWQQVEIIGWLYQFYISDKKDEVIGKVVKSEDIPAATQLFTPNWIVKYLVQNTVGRHWLATYPDSPLRQQMQYYIEPAEQTEEVKAQLAAITPKSLDPETLTLLDDACGSGHILVEAYDLFKAIYQERGYRSKDIPRLILEKNLFGLEIDDRAAQLAAFALLMKARADDRRIFADRVQPNVVTIQESKGLESLLWPDPAAAVSAGELPFADSDLFPDTQKQLTLNKPTKGSPLAEVEPCLRELIKLFEHGKTFGSLIRVPTDLAAQLPAAWQSIEAMTAKGQLWEHRAATLLLPLLKQAELLAKTYDAVVSNPPYMGVGSFNTFLKSFLVANYKGADRDLFSAFIHRNGCFGKPHARLGFMTSFVWMFISSFESLRSHVLNTSTITSLVQLHYDAFIDAKAHVCTFVLKKTRVVNYRSSFVRLADFPGVDAQAPKTLEAISNRKCGWLFESSQDEFKKIPGSPIAYWIPAALSHLFEKFRALSEQCEIKAGMSTTDNALFLRHWHEVPITNTNFSAASSDDVVRSPCDWYPFNKGGYFRKWYGNLEHVVLWGSNGDAIRRYIADRPEKQVGGRIVNTEFFFRECITWGDITSKLLSFRLQPSGCVMGNRGPSIFTNPKVDYVLLAFLNCPITSTILKLVNPTVSTGIGDIGALPYLGRWENGSPPAAEVLVNASRADWNAYERSWDFQTLPILTASTKSTCTLESSYTVWITQNRDTIAEMKLLEEENNRIFIDSYGLTDVLKPDVPIEQITLTVNTAYRYGGKLTEEEQRIRFRRDTMEELISYAIGCMMGRYSLDKTGLVYAHSHNDGFDPTQYRTFPADADGIIPITELAWFPDDATERFVEFIAKAWPRDHLEENLKFIADSLGPNRDEHPHDTIRRYLATAFYKDHLQTYKKRPIYWLFSSGKQRAFQCLVYLHRYHEGTLARMRTEYVIPLQGKIAHRIEQLAGDIAAATSTSHRRRLEKEKELLVKQQTELVAFDEKLRHYADQRISLDLDDGVKVNYGKFGDLLAEVKAVTGDKTE